MVTPVAGLVATALFTLTRPAAISSLACSRERASPRRTSSASSLSRRGGTAQPRQGLDRLAGSAEHLAQRLVGPFEDGHVLGDGEVVQPS